MEERMYFVNKIENEISNLTSEELVKYYMNIQNFVACNLTHEQRIEYKNGIDKISLQDIKNRVMYIKEWIETANQNKIVKLKLKQIEELFPDKLNEIQQELTTVFNHERIYFLENKLEGLKSEREGHFKLEVSKLLIKLRNNMNEDDFYLMLDKIDSLKSSFDKYNFITQEISI